MTNIKEIIGHQFENHRVVFWYDPEEEFKKEYENSNWDGVKKTTYSNAPFYLKCLITHQEQDEKFLIYCPNERPSEDRNWLFDLELAHKVFHSDPAGMYMQEMAIPYEYKPLIQNHLDFFRSKERRQRFKNLFSNQDGYPKGIDKMLSVVFGTKETDIYRHVLEYADSLMNQQSDVITHELRRFNLWDKFWDRVQTVFSYESEDPTIFDFLLHLFERESPLLKVSSLNNENHILLSRWKRDRSLHASFEAVSKQIQNEFRIEHKLSEKDLDQVIDDDLFMLTDKYIISQLIQRLLDDEISLETLQRTIKERTNKYWYPTYRPIYEAIRYAGLMFNRVKRLMQQDFSFNGIEDGMHQYVDHLYEVDQWYRKFIWNYRQSEQNSILKPLVQKVEKVYSNEWLLELNNKWQKVIDALDEWPTNSSYSQHRFFRENVQPYIDQNQRIVVIISDALRYEIGQQLFRAMKGKHRFELEDQLNYKISTIPSYTQLGMAALLPHDKLSLKNESDAVECDGLSSSGLSARKKILQDRSGVRATAIGAEDYMNLHSKQEGRDLLKEHDIIYIFHNAIDKVGDDKDSEEKVFDAVEKEVEFLQEVIKRVDSTMPQTNMIVTADHGFLYQHEVLHESDFAITDVQEETWKYNRRYIIGKNLKGDDTFKHFSGKQVGLQEDIEVLIPKSINRLRVKGAGSRYVHGGASLQETIIPVMKVRSVKGTEEQHVDIDIIKNSDKISSNILPVSFIQSEPMTDERLSRTIKAGVYAQDGNLLSDEFTYTFDIKDVSERNREVKHTFHLSKKADEYNGEWIKLRLEVPIKNSNRWKHYKAFSYQLISPFGKDFDDF